MQPSKLQVATSSGSSELPGLLAYPPILPLNDLPELVAATPPRHLVYVLKAYPESGIAVMIKRDPVNGTVRVVLGDFDGKNLIDSNHVLEGVGLKFAVADAPLFVNMMRAMKLNQAIYYLALENDSLKLVDIRLSLDKFCGPGMVRDLFGKVYPTQEIIKITPYDNDLVKAITDGVPPYDGDLIIKSSMFKTVVRGSALLPFYACVQRTKNKT